MNLRKLFRIYISGLIVLFPLGNIVFAQNVEEITDTEEVMDFEALEAEFSEAEIETFGNTRIINGHSVETLKKGVLEFRIEHRFGDIAGDNGGVQSFYGLDNSTDIRFAFEYGVSDKLMIGLGRSKGTSGLGDFGSPYKSLLDGFVKYRLLHQNTTNVPVSMTFLGTTSYTYMEKSSDVSKVSSFPKTINRFAYSSQLNIARKFGKNLSLSVMPTFVYRNLVASNDVNELFSLGSAIRYSINSKIGVIVEYYQNFHADDFRGTNKNSLGVAVEWNTFGHVFTINLTNSVGFGETQFIPYTFQDWSKGQFRLGFCISRKYRKE
jgi:hypothetical protein